MPFHTINHALKREDSYSSSSYLVADVLRLFGQGTKVALECVMMACDAGLVDVDQPVLGVGGTGHGADTVLSIHAANSDDLFESRIRDVIAKPADPENLVFY
jgi:hypothetical protein